MSRPLTLGRVHIDGHRLERINFKDLQGVNCVLHSSNYASDITLGGSAIWLGLDTDRPDPETGQRIHLRMHLTRVQTRALIGHLEKWLNEGTFRLIPVTRKGVEIWEEEAA